LPAISTSHLQRYEQWIKFIFAGAHYRKDIGAKGIARSPLPETSRG